MFLTLKLKERFYVQCRSNELKSTDLIFAKIISFFHVVLVNDVEKKHYVKTQKIFYIVIMSEDMEDLKERFWNWKNALESKGLKVNTRKTKMMVSGSEGELYKSKIYPCGVCGRRVMANSVLCTQCGNWVHGKCAKIKRVTARLAMHFVCLKCKGIMEGTMDSIEKLCDEVETVNGFCYLGDRLNASGGCEAAATARVRIGWVRFRKCGELLLGNRFPLKMKGKVYCCCVRSAILYGSETWCLKENEKAILRRTERAMVRAMCGQKVVDRKTTEEQMDMLGLKETIDRLATANGVRWYGHVLRRDDDSVLRVALNLEVSGKRKRGRPKKDLEEASGRGDREDWFEEGGCSETR